MRNEEVYKIYDFEKGRGFQPDFILFLKGKTELYYQVFIEPKGDEYRGEDGTFKTGKEGWKEKFLQDISEKYAGRDLLKFENQKYKLIGLPFFNTKEKKEFEKEFDLKIS